ncbi:HWE histidine kinase domain-containing protein [Falsiroseomonas sp.]|uniref:HWE histidine kinase domain-containing protein n=1 Tax=Falsiroseomonas sp. TaxID=2870721 RepID=UPI00356B233F
MTRATPPSGQAAQAPGTAESDRLAALHRYRILDTPDEEPFDRVALLARDLFRTPIALVSFIDGSRQWFKARVGLATRQTPRAWAFCEHAIQAPPGEPFVVTDARADPRFADNPLVTGEPFVRFYAAFPMRSPDGFALGTVCVISDQPRPEGINEAEGRWLSTLAGLASDELELRLHARQASEAAAAEARLRRAQEAAGVTAFEATAEASGGETLAMALRGLLGLAGPPRLELREVPVVPVPEERERLSLVADRLAAEGGTLVEEFRLAGPGESTVWAQLRGEVQLGGPNATPAWRVAGLLRDVSERRAADERQALMTLELDHRAKNALAVVLAALRLTPSSDPRLYAAAVEGRVAALARAHTLLTATRWAGADLAELVRGELRPFLAGADSDGPRARVEGPPVMLAAHAAQPLSMALHELATNALKHGALSAPRGLVEVDWQLPARSPVLRLRWSETGGPPVRAAPSRMGFGSRVLRGTVLDQLGGSLSLTWPPSGLVCTLEVSRARALDHYWPDCA